MTTIRYKEVTKNRVDHQLIGEVVRFAAFSSDNDEPVSIHQWAQALSSDTEDGRQDREEFNQIIANSRFPALFWETKGVTHDRSKSEQFEFVLVQSKALERIKQASLAAFQEHFDKKKNAYVTTFSNLSGDAQLVVPKPIATTSTTEITSSSTTTTTTTNDKALYHHYAHLASFVRKASNEQVNEFWKQVCSEYLGRLQRQQPRPVWLSTSGLGLYWLHARIDSKPKYYSYVPFREALQSTVSSCIAS